MGEAKRRRKAGLMPDQVVVQDGKFPMWVLKSVGENRYQAADNKSADSDGMTSDIDKAAHFEKNEISYVISKFAGEFDGGLEAMRHDVTKAQKWTYQAQYKGVNFEAQPADLRSFLEEVEVSAKAINFVFPEDQQMANSDEFAMMLFETGLHLMDQNELQRILSIQPVEVDVMMQVNQQVLRAGAQYVLECHSKQYLSRAHHLSKLLLDLGKINPAGLENAVNDSGCVPCPLVLARHMTSESLVQDACDFAQAQSAQGFPTAPEVILLIAFTKGMRDDGKGGLFDAWESAAADILERPAASTIAEPILRSGLKTMRRWDAAVGPSAQLAMFEQLVGSDKQRH